MKKSLLISTAALLIAGPAFAQGMQGKEGAQAPGRAPAPQHSVPAEQMAPPAASAPGQSRSMPEAAEVPPGSSRAQDMKKGSQPETTGQGEKVTPGTTSQTRDAAPSLRPPTLFSAGEVDDAERSPKVGELPIADVLDHRVAEHAEDVSSAGVASEAELLQGESGDGEDNAE